MQIDNPWVVTIGGGLIVTALVAVLVAIGRKLFGKRYSLGELAFSIGVATVVLSVGYMLQPAAQLFLEGDSSLVLIAKMRKP